MFILAGEAMVFRLRNDNDDIAFNYVRIGKWPGQICRLNVFVRVSFSDIQATRRRTGRKDPGTTSAHESWKGVCRENPNLMRIISVNCNRSARPPRAEGGIPGM